MARNYWFALGYAALAIGTVREALKASNPSAVPVSNLAKLGGGRGSVANLARPLPTDTLSGENERAQQALLRAGDAVLNKGTLHTVRTIEERVAYIKERINKDSLKPEVREAAIALVSKKCGTRNGVRWCTTPKDYGAEVQAIYAAVQNPASGLALRYVRDHQKVDQFTAANKLLRLRGGDCFVKGTLVLRDDHKLVPIESLRIGDRIWGRDRWSTVQNTWEKGILPTTLIRLNNGSTMRLTADHKVYVARCERHVHRKAGTQACQCQVADRKVERIHVRELKKGDVLLRPDSIPFGTGSMDPNRAYVEGLYVADGWCELVDGRFAISGRDGKPKEEQKRRVRDICDALGISTYWHERYIRVQDAEWTARLATLGTHAPQKHVETLNLDEPTARAMFLGLLADAGANSHGVGMTFSTTSRELLVQMRMLAKMQGITCGVRYVEDHGGLGRNPIWRLQLWGQCADRKAQKLLRVAEIIEDEIALPCFDIATDDHYVYLPEADWTVSNCDDGTILLGAMLMSIGYPIRMRVIQDTGSATWSHIYPLVGLKPGSPSVWAPLDWSVYPFKPAGWQAPGADEAALSGRPSGVVVRVKDFAV